MSSDLEKYKIHIFMLEIINTIIYVLIIFTGVVIGFEIFRTSIAAIIGFLLGMLLGYFIYSYVQLSADRHKLEIEIYKEIKNLTYNKK